MGAALDTMERWFAAPEPELLDPDTEWSVPACPGPREAYRGRDAVFGEFFSALRGRFAARGLEADELIEAAADGQRATALGRYIATTKSGRAVAIPFVHAWTVRDGRIVRVAAATHTAMLAEVARDAAGPGEAGAPRAPA